MYDLRDGTRPQLLHTMEKSRQSNDFDRESTAVDGWDAASFMQALKGLIENPLKLLSMR